MDHNMERVQVAQAHHLNMAQLDVPCAQAEQRGLQAPLVAAASLAACAACAARMTARDCMLGDDRTVALQTCAPFRALPSPPMPSQIAEDTEVCLQVLGRILTDVKTPGNNILQSPVHPHCCCDSNSEVSRFANVLSAHTNGAF